MKSGQASSTAKVIAASTLLLHAAADAAANVPAEAAALCRQFLDTSLADRWLARSAPLEEVTALLDAVPAAERGSRDAALRKRLLILANRPAGDPAALAERISANPKDFEARFALAAIQVFEGDFNAAFDGLLEVVLRDKAEGKPERERARKQLIDWFEACPDAEAVSRGRRYLGMYLN